MAKTHFSGPVASTAGFQDGASAVITISAVTTLTRADHSGRTIILSGSTGRALTLPAVATSAGIKFLFVLGAVYGTSDWTITSAEGDNIEGCIMVASTVVDADAADVITFDESATAENVGDWVSLECDATYWYVDGRALATAAITISG